MNRKLILVVALAAIPVVALAPSASPRANGDTLRGRIVPGKSIGPLRLGMTGTTATRILGRFGAPDVGTRKRAGTANAYVEFEYPAFFSSYSVGLRGRRGNRTVVRISVMIAGNKTAQGIGVGTTERRLRRAYRGRLRCRSYENPNSTYGWIHECLLGRRTERHTLFFMSGEQIIVNRPPLPSRVIRIVVTEPGRFTEFGAGHPET